MAIGPVRDGGGAPGKWKPKPKVPRAQAIANVQNRLGTAPKSTAPSYLAPVKPPQPAGRKGGGTGGGNGGGGGGGSYGYLPYSGGTSSPAIPKQSAEDLAASDDTYMATIAALDRAQKDFNAQYDADLSTYTLDYSNALKNLGYTEGEGKEGVGGKWALNDVGTASGRAYQNNLNDFAARGMLQSSGAFDSENQLLESLLDQYLATRRSKDKYTGDLSRTKAEFSNQDKLARQTALSEASARAAAGLAL